MAIHRKVWKVLTRPFRNTSVFANAFGAIFGVLLMIQLFRKEVYDQHIIPVAGRGLLQEKNTKTSNDKQNYINTTQTHLKLIKEIDKDTKLIDLITKGARHRLESILQLVGAEHNNNKTEHNKQQNKSGESTCTGFYRDANKNRTSTTILNILDAHTTPVDVNDVTLVGHLSISRLQMLVKILEHWEGPVSVTLYLTTENFYNFWEEISQQTIKRKILLHIHVDTGGYYPGNYLRNIALKNARTNYVFLDDIDFIPDPNLHSTLVRHIMNGHLKPHQALIVPALEILSSNIKYPLTKQDVLSEMKRKKVFQFHHELGPAHGPTDYKKWVNSNETYSVKWKRYYEPYIVISVKDCPLYYEGFVGREFNKITQIMEVYARGYEFVVIPDGYIIHLPHKKTKKSSTNLKCARNVYHRFLNILNQKYPDHSKF